MGRKVIYLLTIAVVILFAGCKKQEGYNSDDIIQDYDDEDNDITSPIQPTSAPTATIESDITDGIIGHEGEMRSYLSGLWVTEEIGMKRPYAIQFNNFKLVSDQWGISQADIVYEALVEGGITRLLAIGESFDGDKLGSVRSARHYFVSIADEYDAIYIHYGKTKYAVAKLDELDIDNLDGETGIGTTVFYRDKSLEAPNNAFASIDGILAGIKKKKYETALKEGYEPHFTFYVEDTDLSGNRIANKVKVSFSAYTKPYFEYNSEDKLYYRYQFGDAHKDSNTGKQLAFKNLIIQFVKEWDIDRNDYQTMDIEDSSGSGYYITNGRMVPITWKKKESTSFMRYYNEAGEELSINPGKTFISLFPDNRIEDVTLE